MSKGRKQLAHIQRRPGFANDYAKAEDATKLVQGDGVDADAVLGDPDRSRRFKAPGRGNQLISRKPHVDVLFTSAYITAWEELRRLQDAAEERQLTEEEARRFYRLSETVTKLVKEERAQQAAEKYDDMDPEELIKLAEEAKKVLGS